MKTELSVLITSCDKYSHLLPYCTVLFDKYWEPGMSYRKYISTESTTLEHPDYTPIHTEDANWTNALTKALTKIETPYVFVLLDDFFLRRTITTSTINNALNLVKEQDADKYTYHYPHVVFEGRLDKTKFGNNIFKVQQDADYTLSLQPSIWKVAFLKKCLLAGESPWQFEIEGSARVNKTIQHKIFMEVIDRGFHEEAMSRGKFTPAYQQILQVENLI